MIPINIYFSGSTQICSCRTIKQIQIIMTPTENLYYALGEVAYAVAMSDGRIQKDEVNKLHGILLTELSIGDETQNIADIIFHVLNKDHVDAQTAYESGMKQIWLNSHYLSPDLKLGDRKSV